jgi:hypothetical protein
MLSSGPSISESRQSTARQFEHIDWSSEGYFAALRLAVQIIGPEIPLDPVILQSILLCLIAPGGTRNLLLRVKDEDIGLVQNITSLVSFTYQRHQSMNKWKFYHSG